MFRFTRHFIRALQRLTREYQATVFELLKQLKMDSRDKQRLWSNTRLLANYTKLYRLRKGRLRLFFHLIDVKENTKILWLDVRLRNEQTYVGIYDGYSAEDGEVLSLEEASDEDARDLPKRIDNLATYEGISINEDVDVWQRFILGEYLYNPVLTPEQQAIGTQILKSSFTPGDKFKVLLLQSSPGGGKTVGGTLTAAGFWERGWEVIFIVPQSLVEEINNYDCIKTIKAILSPNDPNFFIGTLRDWLGTVSPSKMAQIATDEEERQGLEKLAYRQHFQELVPLSLEDLLLYRAFIQTRDEAQCNLFDTVYANYARRIELLRLIAFNDPNYLQGKKSWVEGLQAICAEVNLVGDRPLLFIIDEAQDYLIFELKCIINMLKRVSAYRYVVLLLLGDINQRVIPVDFDWGALHLCKTLSLQYNHRNTKRILEFAKALHAFADRQVRRNNDRHLPPPADPDSAVEEGEKVRVLEVHSLADCHQFLAQVSQKVKTFTSSETNRDRYLRVHLLSTISVIYTHGDNIPSELGQLLGIDFLSILDAKGREFDTCIGWGIFTGNGNPSLIEANQWYTLATRARNRLLIIATTAEIERVGRETFSACEVKRLEETDLDMLATWVSELGNSEDVLKDFRAVASTIKKGLEIRGILCSIGTCMKHY